MDLPSPLTVQSQDRLPGPTRQLAAFTAGLTLHGIGDRRRVG